MTALAHMDALQNKHAFLEAKIEAERGRPLPDFATLSRLKKEKLFIKEGIARMMSAHKQRKA